MKLTSFVACLSVTLSLGTTVVTAAEVDVLKAASVVTIKRGDASLTAPSAREAVASAQPGDVIVLGTGTHAGPLIVTTSRVTLRGEPGARVNGNAADWKPVWTKTPEFGPFAYTSPIPWQPVTAAIDQRVMIDAAENRGGLAVHTVGSGRNGREPLGGVFTWQKSLKRIVVSFATDIDPNQRTIEAAKAGDSAITVRGADDCTIENLVITGGAAGVLLTQTKNTVVKNNLIYGTDAGVKFSEGAESCKVLSNDITWNQDALQTDVDPATADVGSDAWHAHKKFGTYDKFGIHVEAAGSNNEIAGNYIYNVWNGITTGSGEGKTQLADYYREKVFKGIANHNRGLKVHHNRLDLTNDDGLEPDGEVVNNEWYSNVVTRARCAARIKTISMGPLWFYDNVLLDSMDGLRLYKSMPEQASVYIMNNVVRFSSAVIYHEMNSVAWDDPWLKTMIKPGTPGVRLYNNVFICKDAFDYNSSDKNEVAPNFKGDYNLYTSSSDPRTAAAGIDAHGLFNAVPQFVDEANGDFHLAPGSPGLGAGQDLAQLSLAAPLPSALAKHVSGGAPNVGLLNDSEPRAPKGPVSGLWSLVATQLDLGERDVTKFVISPSRWVAAPNINFVVDNPFAADNITLTFLRSSVKGTFKMQVLDEAGKALIDREGTPAEQAGLTLAVPTGGAKRLTIRIQDDKNASWQLSAGDNATAGIAASEFVPLRKYDGVPMSFTYPVGSDVASFDVGAQSTYGGLGIEVIAPDGTSLRGAKDVHVDTAGKPGNYRVLISFWKSAAIRVNGGGDGALRFDTANRPSVQLRPLWGKPQF